MGKLEGGLNNANPVEKAGRPDLREPGLAVWRTALHFRPVHREGELGKPAPETSMCGLVPISRMTPCSTGVRITPQLGD